MLAIIIPYYKLTFFEATLQSLASQTDKRFKVYIGDDASPEDCTALLEQYQGKLDFLYHRFNSNLGGISLTQQWERCIALSDGEEWLMILGDDDVLSENVVEEFYKQYDKFYGKTYLVRFASMLRNEKTQLQSKIYQHPIWESAEDSFYRKFKNENRSSLSEYIFSKSKFQKFGFTDYPLAWHSDDIAWLNFSDDKPIYSINCSLVEIRVSNLSLSGLKNNIDFKKEASFKFYRDLTKYKLYSFSKKQRLELLMEYESSIKRIRKVNLKEWGEIIRNHVKNFSPIPFARLFKRIIITIYI